MKAILLLLASLVFLVTIFMCGVFFTAYVIAEPEPHKFAHIDTPDLWTSKPVKVATEGQGYDRLAAVETTASVPASNVFEAGGMTSQQAENVQSPDVDHTVTGALKPQGVTNEADRNVVQSASAGAVDPVRAEWCYARYRSYRVEDNSYQPFSGPRRQCEAPGTEAHQAAAALPRGQGYDAAMQNPDAEEEQDQLVADRGSSMGGADVQGGSHEGWCQARYRSYRIEDNSYQPLDGGPRRACQSPFG
ncbi:BA14K family protein [Rhizobium deserti]|uniref:Lectin-like protein BA14k n=1 Tax=Rhizobium deserti TaxID=2547961 RepID=A0A4R5UIW3_9HYPH|nr:BA14K family protein [Rhizobium deserti]TDK36778.1 BA14K family protein [Rhizobium deserti]